MNASSHRLAMALAERIGEVLPAPLTIRAAGSGVSLIADGELLGGSDAPSILDDEDDGVFSERVETAARAALDGIQDCVMRYLTEEWPIDSQGTLALPDARTEAGVLHIWYGTSEKTAAIRLRPIATSAIQA